MNDFFANEFGAFTDMEKESVEFPDGLVPGSRLIVGGRVIGQISSFSPVSFGPPFYPENSMTIEPVKYEPSGTIDVTRMCDQKPKQKVWLVAFGVDCEGVDMVSVCASLKAAEKIANETMKLHEGHWTLSGANQDNSIVWSNGVLSVQIDEWGVQS